jgi:gluconolactonase
MPDGGIVFTNNNFLTRLDAAGNATTFVEVSNGANGLGFDTKGRLIAVERKPMDERVGVLYPPDAVTTLADKADGKPFEALNDLVVSSRDAVYFTDHNGVYYLPAGGGKVTKVAEAIPNPNGVQLSPDERTLYANNKDGEYLRMGR